MPEPASAFSVRRVANVIGKDTCPSTAGGMPSRPTVWSSAIRAGVVRASDASTDVGCSGRGSSLVGTSPVMLRSTGTANCGAWAAAANALTSSTVFCGSGLARWKASPSRSGRCARWSIALAT